MKRVLAASLALAWLFGSGVEAATAGEKEPKALSVGKDGLKIDSKITGDDKKHDYTIDFGGKELKLSMAAKVYTIKLEAANNYTITMDTDDEELDPFVVVQDADGKTVAFDDDSGGGQHGLNAKATFKPAKDGVFKVNAAALGNPKLKNVGAFTLKVVAAKAPVIKALTVGKEGVNVKGTLKDDNRKIEYHVKMKAGKTYTIDLKSKDFDAYLFLFDGAGKKLAEDDDGGGDLNSRIVHKAAEDGTYRIIATSLGMRENGDYELEIREED